jgi:hypothetical protein
MMNNYFHLKSAPISLSYDIPCFFSDYTAEYPPDPGNQVSLDDGLQRVVHIRLSSRSLTIEIITLRWEVTHHQLRA